MYIYLELYCSALSSGSKGAFLHEFVIYQFRFNAVCTVHHLTICI